MNLCITTSIACLWETETAPTYNLRVAGAKKPMAPIESIRPNFQDGGGLGWSLQVEHNQSQHVLRECPHPDCRTESCAAKAEKPEDLSNDGRQANAVTNWQGYSTRATVDISHGGIQHRNLHDSDSSSKKEAFKQ